MNMRSVWNGLTATLVLFFIGACTVGALAPASWWLEVRSVRVVDTVAGVAPVMHVDRQIHQDFLGTYIVDVERKQPDGRYTVVCSAYSRTNYRTDAKLPDPVTLDWWSWPIKCQLQPGLYRVETRWVIEAELFSDKHVAVMSNEFLVK
jgi:hypothetical protein